MVEVLRAAGYDLDLFDARVDGRDAARVGLPGKPDPAMFLEAVGRLRVEPKRAAVIEDALAGVEAGRRGGFGLVLGVDRTGHGEELLENGADVVVRDLAEVRIEGARDEPTSAGPRPIRDLASPLDREPELESLLHAKTPAVFLDYDGTLTPIVERPEQAKLTDDMRRTLARLADRVPVAVISGRDLDDVRAMVALSGLELAGSHGFDIVDLEGRAHQHGTEFLPALDQAERELGPLLEPIPGARVERKRFAIAVHYRGVADEHVAAVEDAVNIVASRHPELRRTGGKKVFELRPGIEWDKGQAVIFLLGTLGLDRPDVIAIYVGDDETDEDAFRALRDRGLGVVVADEDDVRTTWARFRLPDVEGVRTFLEWVAERAASPR
jgi:trehalose-phosphatase